MGSFGEDPLVGPPTACGNRFIGHSRAKFCSQACRQRAHRSNRNANRNASHPPRVTVTAAAPVAQTGRSAEALALIAALDDELLDSSEDAAGTLEWSAAERQIIESAADTLDRRAGLRRLYETTKDDKLRLKISGELRLLDALLARLLA
jgi:hypothetical protein